MHPCTSVRHSRLSTQIIAVALTLGSQVLFAQTVPLVKRGADGRLAYANIEDGTVLDDYRGTGNVVPDYSGVGYLNSESAIPAPTTVVVKLTPVPGEDRAADIRAAIAQVAARPKVGNFRGVIEFAAGEFIVGSSVVIDTDGIVLRGAGVDSPRTTIKFTGRSAVLADKIACFEFKGPGGVSLDTSKSAEIAPSPYGAKTITLNSDHGFQEKDWVVVEVVYNAHFATTLRMDAAYMGAKPWPLAATFYRAERQILRIDPADRRRVTLDAPLMDPVDPAFGTAKLVAIAADRRHQHVGIEQMRIESAPKDSQDLEHGWRAVAFNNIRNGWVRSVDAHYFVYSTATVLDGCSFITVENCKYVDGTGAYSSGRFYSFDVNGERVLVQHCKSITGGRHDFVTGSWTPGPNVFFDCEATGSRSDSGPHHRWSTGHLYDAVSTNWNIRVRNRGTSGGGHGWTGAQIMLWNCASASSSVVQNPPGPFNNFSVGFRGKIDRGDDKIGKTDELEPAGIIQPELPAGIPSLFQAQLSERLASLGISPAR